MPAKALLAAIAVLAAAAAAIVLWLQLSGPPARPGAIATAVALPAQPATASLPAPLAAATPARPVATPPAAAGNAATTTAPPAAPGGALVLVPAPDPSLVEKTADGPLPVIAPDGRQAWQTYARPFDNTDKRPRIAIVIGGLGLAQDATEQAIRDLPPAVALAFMPYYPIGEALQQARSAGHETLIDLPMEPLDYPRQDPGPRALLTGLDPQQNLARLRWMLSRGTGYIGMMTYMGSRFAAAPDLLRPVLLELKQRGLAFVDARATGDGSAFKLATALRMARGQADRIIDSDMSRAAIDRQLADLENLARRGSAAIGVGNAYPVTIRAVAAWAAQLDRRGAVLAPVSAVLVQ